MQSDLLAAIEAPISESSPTGSDVTYDDDFQRLKAAVDGIGSIRADGTDYETIVELGTRVLTGKSKDVRVAVFLAFGLERMHGVAGIADGVAAVDAIVRTYWDGMFPPVSRMTGRQNALQSLSDRLKESVASLKPVPDDRPELERARDHVKALQEFTLEVMGDKAPALSGLVQALEGALRRIPAAGQRQAGQNDSPSANGSPQAEQAVAAPVPAAAGAIVSLGSLTDARNAVIRTVDFLRQEDPTSPLPYRLARVVHWAGIVETPPSDGGRTRIPAPPSQRLEFLQRLLEERKYGTLVKEAEDSFHEFPLLLDAQRLVVQAMEGLPGYEAARDAVLLETAILLRRVERLSTLTFDDGTPMCGGPTRAWIDADVLPLLGEEPDESSGTGDERSALDEHFEKARAQLGKGDVAGAIATMEKEGGPDESGHARLRRKLLTARLSLSAGRSDLARSILEALHAEVERRNLAEWQPELALEVWTSLHKSLVSLVGSAQPDDRSALKSRADQVFERICSLDACRALALTEQ